nr:MAG TPA: hypothetical protein [Caudoviricetes sp.]
MLIVRFWAFPVREDGKGFCFLCAVTCYDM